MNFKDCVKITINDSVADVLDLLSYLPAVDRSTFLMEHLEDVATEIHMDDVFMVPKFQEE